MRAIAAKVTVMLDLVFSGLGSAMASVPLGFRLAARN
jgi:hypothetical protein